MKASRPMQVLHKSQALQRAHCATDATQIRAKMNLKTGWKVKRGE
jgi:hypothetical protein